MKIKLDYLILLIVVILEIFFEIELSLDQYYILDTNIVNSLGTLQIASDSFDMELKSKFDNLMQGDSVIFFNDSEVVNLIDTLCIIYSTIETTINTIDTIRYSKMDSLNTSIIALQVNSEYDSLYKELFLIKLKLLESDTFSNIDYNFIYELAMECPKDLGTIVHKANSLLNWDDHLENLNLNCSSSLVLGVSELTKNHNISVFPNPMTSEMSILADYPINECYMTDILGNIIPIDIEIDPKIRRSMEVKLNNVGIPTGSYILSIIFNDKTTTYKLVIKN